MRKLDFLFPEQEIFANNPSRHVQVVVFAALFGIFYFLGALIPADGLFAFDWIHFFEQGNIPPFYPPWTDSVVRSLNWQGLIAFSLTGVALASYRRATSAISVACALLTLPLFWTIFLGQLDGLVVLGILGLPLLAPLALLKPQLSIFSFLARRSFLIGLLITVGVSLVIWGFWPPKLFSVWTVHGGVRYVNDIALGLLGLPVAVVLLWFSRGDVDMLMLAGAFATPYLLPYNLIVVVPAIARLKPVSAAVASVLSWIPLTSNWIGPAGWWTAWLFVVWLWVSLALKRYPILAERLRGVPRTTRS